MPAARRQMRRSRSRRCASMRRTAPGGVLLLEQRDDARVLVVLARRIARRLVQRDDQRAARDELRQVLLQDAVASQGGHLQVERAREARPRRLVGGVQRRVLVAQLPAQRGDVGPRGVGGGHRQQRCLERPPGLEDLPRFLRRRCGHDRAAVGPQLDDVVVRELLQHLADQRAADAEELAQRHLRQLGAGREPLAHHAFEDLAVDPRGVVFVWGEWRAAVTIAPRVGARSARAPDAPPFAPAPRAEPSEVMATPSSRRARQRAGESRRAS